MYEAILNDNLINEVKEECTSLVRDLLKEDYQKVARAKQIRNASDYDDFYLASKEETRQQVENAGYLVEKVKKYITELNVQ